MKFFYVYVLYNKSKNFIYIGYSKDIVRRLKEHNKRSNIWILIYYEAYRSEDDARRRERKLKDYGQSRTHLKNRIKDSLLSLSE